MASPNVHDPNGIRNTGARDSLATGLLGICLMMVLTTWWWYAMR